MVLPYFNGLWSKAVSVPWSQLDINSCWECLVAAFRVLWSWICTCDSEQINSFSILQWNLGSIIDVKVLQCTSSITAAQHARCQKPVQYGSWGLNRYIKQNEVQRTDLRIAESLFSLSGWSYSSGHVGFLVLGDIKSRLKYFSFILNCGRLHFPPTPIPLLLVLA